MIYTLKGYKGNKSDNENMIYLFLKTKWFVIILLVVYKPKK